MFHKTQIVLGGVVVVDSNRHSSAYMKIVSHNVRNMAGQEISITGHDLITMCRLCLSRGVTTVNVFGFSTRFQDKIADVIMKCAPIQILRCDEMPKFICQLCCTQLENTYQFQTQIIQSDKTLRRYLQKLHASDKQALLEGSILRPSEDSLIDNTNVEIKCVSSELHGDSNVNWREKEYEYFNATSKINDELSLKSKIKIEQTDGYSIIALECADGTVGTLSKGGDCSDTLSKGGDCSDTLSKGGDYSDISINEKELEAPTNFNSGCKNIEEISLKFKIKVEQMDDNSIIPSDGGHDSIRNLSQGLENSNINTDESKVEEPANFNSGCKSIEEIYIKSEIKNEPMDDESLISIESNMDTVNASSNDGGTEINCVDVTSANSACVRSTDVRKKIEKCKKKKTSVTLTQSTQLNTHKRRHTGEKPYHCKICNKCFINSDGLKNHMRTHTGEKPNQCEICNKDFASYRNLINHKRTHTGDKPYRCDICDKYFAQSVHLINHKRRHTGEKPYQCNICNKCFVIADGLKNHMRIHTGEKPYQCDICNSNFAYYNNLKSHKRLHTGEKPYQCDNCDKCFTQSCSLKFHKRIHVGEKSNKCDM